MKSTTQDNWKCTKCGSCCAIVGCVSLTKDRLCEIYEKRPAVCRVKTGATMDCITCRQIEKDFKEKGFTPPKKTIRELEDYLLCLLNESNL